MEYGRHFMFNFCLIEIQVVAPPAIEQNSSCGPHQPLNKIQVVAPSLIEQNSSCGFTAH
jgi:hypothetical protein